MAIWARGDGKSVRLIGVGVSLKDPEPLKDGRVGLSVHGALLITALDPILNKQKFKNWALRIRASLARTQR